MKKEEKRVVIAGTRTFNDYETAKMHIDKHLKNMKELYEIVIMSGGAKGTDALGERYAEENGFKIERYTPDWKTYKKGAGPIRNELMASLADYVICFWDGKSRGTKSMIEYSFRLEKPIEIIKI